MKKLTRGKNALNWRWNEELERLICDQLREHGCLERACREVGISPGAVWQRRNPRFKHYREEFARAYEEAIAAGRAALLARLEREADRRAAEGVPRLKFDKHGRPLIDPRTGEPYVELEYSDQLLMFRLKRLDPEGYRENSRVESHMSGEVKVSFYLPQKEELARGRALESGDAPALCDGDGDSDTASGAADEGD